MRRRLYFVLPDLNSAETIERELLLAKVDDPHIHFLARDGINMGRLHVANLLQRSDLLHGIGIGMVAGGVTGAGVVKVPAVAGHDVEVCVGVVWFEADPTAVVVALWLADAEDGFGRGGDGGVPPTRAVRAARPMCRGRPSRTGTLGRCGTSGGRSNGGRSR